MQASQAGALGAIRLRSTGQVKLVSGTSHPTLQSPLLPIRSNLVDDRSGKTRRGGRRVKLVPGRASHATDPPLTSRSIRADGRGGKPKRGGRQVEQVEQVEQVITTMHLPITELMHSPPFLYLNLKIVESSVYVVLVKEKPIED